MNISNLGIYFDFFLSQNQVVLDEDVMVYDISQKVFSLYRMIIL